MKEKENNLKYNLNKLTPVRTFILINGTILGGLYRLGVNSTSNNSLSNLILNNLCKFILGSQYLLNCFNLYVLFLIIATFISILFVFNKIHKKHIDSLHAELLFFIGFLIGVISFGFI
ncbi:MAG: hypothetical protein ACOCRX_01985 [Candidatus Woesearchaeota archaeon]